MDEFIKTILFINITVRVRLTILKVFSKTVSLLLGSHKFFYVGLHSTRHLVNESSLKFNFSELHTTI